MSVSQLEKEFVNPSAPFRSKPFWAWNDKLEEPELRRQIRLFREMGFGGFFMHSRVGLKTPYLSKEWFDLVRSCIDEAKKTGLLEQFATQNPKHEGAAWVYEQLVAAYAKANEPDKLIAAGEKLLAIDPADAETGPGSGS
jgi:hypothetical protein